MSKKQLGAAPMAESKPAAGKPNGWFGRLRAQPGFRTASVAFVLTVVLGIGSTAAYAYWSQSQTVNIVGTTGYKLPVPTAPVCVTAWGAEPNRVEWSPAAGADPEARHILTFQAQKKSVSYAVPPGIYSVEPFKMDELYDAFGGTGGDIVPLKVTLETGIVSVPVSGKRPIKLEANQILFRSAQGASKDMFYHTFRTHFWGNYPCMR
ncbi:hypothetical protein KKR91_05070 [Arthrobacter jiangjiafuii]|uniref:Uncharacterized protein n=1 Tax=Arthrobacter jiangjiafuii TaxID=2817475 RepID=A0A975M6P4_9MICC|nr:hypothetical protein [Arthrobacter jiangjiafuii]MBP3043978.1 hypothetical protein [Arthrobacter jiangjiafuii]QWC10973.1 hypothetical protein KKR91_05070 [Arthrobacter jiangjiafuii]